MSGNYKFIVIGSSGVGKTAILKRLVDDVFTGESQSTIGVEFLATSIEIDGQVIKLQIWDTAGQERFRSIAKAYFRSAIGVILIFDLTDRKSYDDLNHWLGDVHTLCDPNAVITLIGNKCDLVDTRVITATEADNFAKVHQLTYLETSARDGDNIQETFQRTAAAVYRRSLAYNKDAEEKIDVSHESTKRSCC
ncbi:Ras-related protein Rab-4B [Tritrichomonas foetus]|uniref:Ras-related protein Rab-4B n=1 Tax=Tritrichomonas foetus TaxID=1144522 RepID=A0A1J4KDY0_9EUKA|nr:Ras-related protein Rab-4B [Tritrichomonas foetus]|eukprot:OHT07669.1 Ras-related protein Rab-4B [Tritrichomonas foetus]